MFTFSYIKILSFSFISCIIVSCQQNKPVQKPENEISINELKEPLIERNKKINEDEQRAIDAYTKRRNWKMEKTGTGVEYMIYEKGDGILAQSGDIVVIYFNIQLLDGTPCYKTNTNEPYHFKVDYSNTESGMHEAIKFLHKGDKAIVIIPSHRAFGLAGDMDKIPPLSTVVYQIELLDVIQDKKS